MKIINLYIDKFRLTNFGGVHRVALTIDQEEYLVNIFDTYNITIQNGQLISNIDIFYVSHHETYQKLSEFLPLLGNRLIYDKQYKKSSNIMIYNKLISEINPNYISTNIYGCFDRNEDISEYVFEHGKYYVKPEYGARSLNQFIVDSKAISLSYFLAHLEGDYIDNIEENAERIKKLVESSNGAIKHIKGNERFINEHAKSDLEYCVQEAVQNIRKEYRVINVGYGEKLYFFERQRNDSNDGIVDNEINFVNYVCYKELDSIKNSLQHAFKLNKFFYGSVDLVVTENGKWSIIETSNQYGGADIKPKYKYEIVTNVLTRLIKIAKDDIDHLV